jgi:PAS domain S-box-containing protein
MTAPPSPPTPAAPQAAAAAAVLHCWPAAASVGAALALGGLAWQSAAPQPDGWWLGGLLAVAAAALPVWLVRQLRRQSHAADELARQLQQQSQCLRQLERDAELLRRAEQVAQLGSFDWNPDTGALHWSDQHFRLWGHEPGALVPDYAAFRARIHPDDVGPLEARLQHALQTGNGYEFNHRVVWTDGTVREVLARGDVTRDARGRAVRMVGTVQDVTHRRAAEQRLQLHEFVLNTIADTVSVIDQSRTYLLVNRAWCLATGERADEVVGRHVDKVLPRLIDRSRDAALQRAIDSGRSEVLLAALDLDGSGVRWWETSIYPFADVRQGGRRGAALVSRDVTAREAAARALADSVEHLRLTLNTTGDAIFASDAADPRQPLLFVNDRMLQMWDIPPEEAAGLSPAGVMTAARRFFVDPERETARVAEVIASHALQEDRLILNDGRVLLRRCIPTTLGGRELRVWSFRDITIESRALAGLRAVEAQQRALLAAFPGFIACIAADHRISFANPRLAALLGSTPQALVGEPAGLLVPADNPQQLARRIARVLDGEILRLERMFAPPGQAPVHVLITLAGGLDRAAGQMQCYAFGTDITQQKATEAALLAARDEARQAIHAQRAFVDRMSHELRTPLHSVLGFAGLLQADARPPLSPVQREHVGQILAGGHEIAALVDDLLAATRVQPVDSAPDEPAQPLPAPGRAAAAAATAVPGGGDGDPARLANPASAPEATAGAGLPVLYIDDNPVNTMLMAAMFERLPGLSLRCEGDPHGGLASAIAAPPALLLIDIQMPGMDGYQLLERLRAEPATRGVPAIAVSANAMPQDLARGQAAGFADYLTKPLELQRLQAALQAALPGWSPPG